MDKEFWVSIAKNDYAIPKGHTLAALTKTLFGYLGSTDSKLRDDIAYTVYANWLKREMFTKEEVSTHITELLANLDKGIGETDSDSVFLRTFSVLLLAEIVQPQQETFAGKGRSPSHSRKGTMVSRCRKRPARTYPRQRLGTRAGTHG